MSLKPKKYLSVAELFKSLSKISVKSLFRDFLAHPFRWAKSRPDVHRGGVLSWKSVVSGVICIVRWLLATHHYFAGYEL